MDFLKQGDTKTVLSFMLQDETGNPLTLSENDDLEVNISNNSGLILVKENLTIDTDGSIKFSFDSDDITGVGKLRLEFKITYADGKVLYLPKNSYFTLFIEENLENVQGEVYPLVKLAYEDLIIATADARQVIMLSNEAIANMNTATQAAILNMDQLTQDALNHIGDEISTLAALREATETAKNDANEATEAATLATEAATQATSGANTAASNASTEAANAKTQADFAKSQGETAQAQATEAAGQAAYAKAQGDYAKQTADTNKNIYQIPVANFAAIATTYPNPSIGWKVQTTNDGKFYRFDGSSWVYTEIMNNAALADIQTQLVTANKQSAMLEHGLNVLNTTAATMFDPIVQGRTLANLWQNAQTEDLKNYIATFANRNVGLSIGGAYTYANTKFQGVKTIAPVLMADFAGKVSGSTVENPHTFKGINVSSSLVPPNGTWLDTSQAAIDRIKTQDGTLHPLVGAGNVISQQLFSFNLIRHIEDTYGTIPRTTVADKVQWIKDNVAKITANWWGKGSSPTGNKAVLSIWRTDTNTWANYLTTSTNATISKISLNPSFLAVDYTVVLGRVLDSSGLINLLAYADASDGTTASTIETDYINLEVELKPYTVTSTYNDNFVGKVSGSVVENPHYAGHTNKSTLEIPSASWSELVSQYTGITSLNAAYAFRATSTSGEMAQTKFSFNLIELYKRKTGLTIAGTLAQQVQWLKDNITQITANWWGFGSSPSGNKASFAIWSGSNWESPNTNNSSTVSKVSVGIGVMLNRIDSNGNVHYLAYADASDGTTPSTINTDMIDIDVTFKNSFRNTIRPTKIGAAVYEVDTATYNKVNVDPAFTGQKLLDKYPYVDGIKSVNNPVVTVAGKNLLPPFTEWTLHANATVKSAYELELVATTEFSRNYLEVNVIPNQTYTLSATFKGRLFIRRDSFFGSNLQGGFVDNGATTQYKTMSVTIPSDVTKIYVTHDNNSISGTFTFTNPQLELGTTATPFEPKNDDYLYANLRLSSDRDGNLRDEIYKRDGQWLKLKRFETVVLDGLVSGLTGVGVYTGYKRASFNILDTSRSQAYGVLIDYRGQLMKSGGVDGGFVVGYGNTGVYLHINNTETGFTESMTPTSNMWKGYFNGWRYTGNGTTHSWVSIVDGSSAPTQTEAYVSANRAPNYTPYELVYQLATPKEEVVTVEGALSLQQGANLLEVNTGVVVREKVTPVLSGGIYYINRPNKGHSLNRRVSKIIIYKNGFTDNKWTIRNDSVNGNGLQYADIPQDQFDPTAEYTVTYLILDKHLQTANIQTVKGEYETNLKEVVGRSQERLGDIETTVSINTALLVNILARLKAGGL